MAKYRITVEVDLLDNAYHPRKWVPQAIQENLEEGEKIALIQIEDLPADTQPTQQM